MWSMGKNLCAMSAMLTLTACSMMPRSSALPPPPPQPPPASCLEPCSVNVCTLGEAYEALPTDEARAKREVKCTEANANAARYCATLHAKCAGALEDRARRDDTAK